MAAGERRESGIYIFYADVFLVQNCLMNAGILLVLREIAGVPVKVRRKERFWGFGRFAGRLAAVSITAGLLQLLVLCITGSYFLYLAVSFVIVIPQMVYAVLGRTRIPVFIKRVLLGYLVAVLLGGFVGALENLCHLQQIPVWISMLSIFALKEGVLMLRNQRKKQEALCTVILRHRGQEMRCTALWDTGNRLKESGTNRPVHIISRAVYRGLSITAEDYAGLTGYCTLGEEDGILPLYEIDALLILQSGQKTEQVKRQGATLKNTKAVVACAGEHLLAQKPYQVILNVEGAGT
jgi:hypothetical protein